MVVLDTDLSIGAFAVITIAIVLCIGILVLFQNWPGVSLGIFFAILAGIGVYKKIKQRRDEIETVERAHGKTC